MATQPSGEAAPSARELFARGEQIHERKWIVLERVQLARPMTIVTAICVAGVATAAISLAFAGMSTIPLLCLTISLPAYAWAARHAVAPLSYRWSLGYVAYCDLVVIIGLFVVTTTNVGFVKLAWLVLTSVYVYVLHGRIALAVQAVLMVIGLVIVIVGAVHRADVSVPMLIIATVTVLVANVCAAWVVYAGLIQFGKHADRTDYMATHDELTGLLNRHGLQDACNNRLDPRSPDVVLTAAVDLDRFKPINDTYGHSVGDQVLRRTAERLRMAAGEDAFVARLGGDEFAVVAQLGERPAAELAIALQRCLVNHADAIPVTGSIGVVTVSSSALEHQVKSAADVIVELLDSADDSMYEAKRYGGNRMAGPPRLGDSPVSMTYLRRDSIIGR